MVRHLSLGLIACVFSLGAPVQVKALEPIHHPIFGGICIVDKSCRDSISATCAQLHCRAQSEKCNGDYSSGACKDIKDLHDAGTCSVVTKDCGSDLPSILDLPGLLDALTDDDSAVIAIDDTGGGGGNGIQGIIDDIRDEAAVAMAMALAGGSEIEDRDSLGGRLSVSETRMRSIQTGAGSAARFGVAAAGLVGSTICVGGGCVCIGDDSCNDMFEGACADPDIPAVCLENDDGAVLCACSF